MVSENHTYDRGETIIPQNKKRDVTDPAGYSRSALEVQLKLADYAKKLTPDMYGFVVGREGHLLQLQRYTPTMIGRKKGDRPSDFLDLTPYGAGNRGVSRVHARIYLEDDHLFVEDMNSRNGTFVNNEPVNPFKTKLIGHGDRLRLGNLVMVLVLPQTGSGGISVLQLSATIATEDSLQFLTEQLTPYLLALAETQRVFTGGPILSADMTEVNPIRYGNMSVTPTSAMIEGENVQAAVRFIIETQYAQQRAPYRPLPELIQELDCTKALLSENPDALGKLSALAKQIIGTRIALSV